MKLLELEWRAAPMPGGSGPVELAPLPSLDDHAFRAYVRFPPGWSRREAGHYAQDEEFLVLDGELHLNELTWRAGDYARLPARFARRDMHTATGCLVLVRFGATPRWVPGPPDTPADPAQAIGARRPVR